jgi:hypothetical protein
MEIAIIFGNYAEGPTREELQFIPVAQAQKRGRPETHFCVGVSA